MTIKEAHEELTRLMAAGAGGLEMYTEYEKIQDIRLETAQPWRDGSQLELAEGNNFVYVYTDH